MFVILLAKYAEQFNLSSLVKMFEQFEKSTTLPNWCKWLIFHIIVAILSKNHWQGRSTYKVSLKSSHRTEPYEKYFRNTFHLRFFLILLSSHVLTAFAK